MNAGIPIEAAAECCEEVGDGCGVFDPEWHVGVGVEVDQLPHVGHPPHPVTQDEEAHDGQADLGMRHLPPTPGTNGALRSDFDNTKKRTCQLNVYYERESLN